MSFDFKVERTCDHYIVEDIAFINADNRTIDFVRSVASTQSLILKRNGFVIAKNNPAYPWILTNSANAGLKAISFTYVQKSNDDFYELSYTTSLLECPKCLGTGFVFDYSLDVLGQLVTVEKEDKLMQDVVKGVASIKGSNPYFVWYGTVIDSLIGTKITSLSVLRTAIARDVNTLIANLKDMQGQQKAIVEQAVTPNEMIDSLISITVTQPNPVQDPTTVQAAIVVRSVAGNLRVINRVINVNLSGNPINNLKIA